MGYSKWSDDAYQVLSKAREAKAKGEIFRHENSIDPLMQPYNLSPREARDSPQHPASVPIIVAFDVTGSMGDVPARFAKDLLGDLMDLLVDSGYTTDPQILFAAIGDAASDRAPLQIGQFESGLEMDIWLTKLWLEARGGDEPESYLLAHWFAAFHTATDSWEKRNKKGYLFTIGDAPNKPLTDAQVQRVFGYQPTESTDDDAVIAAAGEAWNCFHIHVTRHHQPPQRLVRHWMDRLGPRLLLLDETEAICSLIGVVIGISEGTLDPEDGKKVLVNAGMSTWHAKPIIDNLT
jgi:hypothetical protein